MPRWLPRVLEQIRLLGMQHKVRFTYKAYRELAALELGLDEIDACQVLADLSAEDSAGRLLSERTGEWLYVFKPRIADTTIYLKVVLRTDCVIVSFHEDRND